jgi:uncharacterized delta-60 repeat protein
MGGGGWGVVAGAMMTLVVSHGAWGDAGDLDPSFGVGGVVITAAEAGSAYLNGVAVQPDGAIVAVGTMLVGAGLDFAVARYAADGMLDLGFGTSGIATIDFGTASDVAVDVALQPDGKIVVAGRADESVALARLLPDGRLDATFGGDGTVTTPTGFPNGAWAAAVQQDAKIVAVAGSGGLYLLVRYDAHGVPDPSFGRNGLASARLSFGFGDPYGLAVQADGKLVVAGTATVNNQVDMAVARFDSDGHLDSSFGTGGFVTTGIARGGTETDKASAVALQPDGKIVVAGYSCGLQCDFGLARYDGNGNLDPTFGSDGRVLTDVGGDSDFGIVRYRADGSLDPTFGGDGKVTTGIGPSTNAGNAVALQPDGRLVVAGSMYNGTTYDFALARYLGDPVCGNGIVESPEACDDGNAAADCCRTDCTLAASGARVRTMARSARSIPATAPGGASTHPAMPGSSVGPWPPPAISPNGVTARRRTARRMRRHRWRPAATRPRAPSSPSPRRTTAATRSRGNGCGATPCRRASSAIPRRRPTTTYACMGVPRGSSSTAAPRFSPPTPRPGGPSAGRAGAIVPRTRTGSGRRSCAAARPPARASSSPARAEDFRDRRCLSLRPTYLCACSS